MKTDIATPAQTDCATQQLRMKVSAARTKLLGDHVYDKDTYEYYGRYIKAPFSPEPVIESPGIPSGVKRCWTITEDGSPHPSESNHSEPWHLASVVELFPMEHTKHADLRSQSGRKPQVISNPLASALLILKLEEWPTPWLDDIAFGAIYTGPGVVNGKHSVSLADVKKVLCLPELSVVSAAEQLLNHDRQPMSIRQLQRVIEAARVALRGIALHLERHRDILQSIDATIDFDQFWENQEDHLKSSGSREHPKKQQALEMITSGIPTKTIAKEIGISKNTVKVWKQQALGAA